MNADMVHKDLSALIHRVCRCPRIWMTHGEIKAKQVDKPLLFMDKLVQGNDANEFALILKSGSIPVIQKLLTGPREDPVVSITRDETLYTIKFRSDDKLIILLPSDFSE